MGQPKLVEKEDDFESVFADELEPGHVLMQGQYTIEAFLNAGGFGITYRARDSLDRPVVIKECFPGSFCRRTTTSVQARSRAHQRELSSIVQLFVQEARSLARLDHPNIVGVHQVFEENNTAYMALDFVEGRDLLDIIEDPADALEPDQVERILRKLLDAVGFIHAQGVLHRDISPDNILLQPDMDPILIDFGAAREEASKQSRVLSAMRVVKDGYSPQEFYITGSEQGQFSDLYALGATFYHLITGELPANSQARLAAVAAGDPDPYLPVADRMPSYSEKFLHGIDKSLEILPKDRIESAQKWLSLLDGEATEAASQSKPAKKSKAKADPVVGSSSQSNKSPVRTILLASVALVVPLMGVLAITQFSGEEATPNTSSNAPVEIPFTPMTPDVGSSSSVLPAPVEDVATVEPVGDVTDVFWATSESSAPPVAPVVVPAAAAPAVPEIEPVIEKGPVSDVPNDRMIVEDYQFIAPSSGPTVSDVSDDRFVSVAYAPLVQNPIEVSMRPSVRPGSEVVVEEVAPAVPEVAVVQEPVAVVPEPVVQPTPEVAEPAPVTDPALAWMNIRPSSPEPAPVAPSTPAEAAVEASSDGNLEVFSLPQILSGWTVELPSGLTTGSSNVYSINGIDIDGLADVDSVLRQNFAAPVGNETEVTVLAGESRETAEFLTLTVPVLHRTLFLNGMMFETRPVDGTWVTTATAVPARLGSDLQVGDILAGDLSRGALFNSRTSLPDLLVQAHEQRRSLVSVATRRDGQAMSVDIQLPR